MPEYEDQALRLVSWNTDSTRRIEIPDLKGLEHFNKAYVGSFSIYRRIPYLFKDIDYFIDEKNVGIFALQEADAVAEFTKKFEERGFQSFSSRVSPYGFAFTFFFAFDPSRYELQSTKQIYLTVDGTPIEGENRDHNLRARFTQSVQCNHMKDLRTGKPFYVVNTHLELDNDHKLLASQKICDELKHITDPIFIVGDLNQFNKDLKPNAPDPAVYEFKEQIEVFKQAGYQHASAELNKAGLHTSFVCYPYDILRFLNQDDFSILDEIKARCIPKEIRQFFLNAIKEKAINLLGGVIDSVYCRNLPDLSAEEGYKPPRSEVMYFIQGKRIEPGTQEEFLAKMIGHYEKNEPGLDSDHLPIFFQAHLGH